ncbi:MAG: hypothetical protein H6868_08905 [Rhodospirillales bacterium]|nr:hypothetical protein [Rhodospirillales bacterium]
MFRAMNLSRIALLSLVILPLGGCETMNKGIDSVQETVSNIEWKMPEFLKSNDQKPTEVALESTPLPGDECPEVSVVDDLRALHQFTDEQTPLPEGKISSITMSAIKSHCLVNTSNMIVDLDLTFSGEIGPKALNQEADNEGNRKLSYPYFLAISTPDGHILSKEVFAVSMEYSADTPFVTKDENIRQIIPLHGDIAATDYKLLLGFQLNDAELAYNRSLLKIEAQKEALDIPQSTQGYIPQAMPTAMDEPEYIAAPEATVPKPAAKPDAPVATALTEETPPSAIASQPVVIPPPVESEEIETYIYEVLPQEQPATDDTAMPQEPLQSVPDTLTEDEDMPAIYTPDEPVDITAPFEE